MPEVSRTLAIAITMAMAMACSTVQAQAQSQEQPSASPSAAPFGVSPVSDERIFYHLLVDQLEGRFGFAEGNTFRWEATGWVGTDENRIWLLTEGRYSNNELDDGIHQLFYGRALSTYFDGLVGIRYDLDSLPSRGWGAIGIQGLAPQFFKVSAFGYVSGEGHLAARLEASYDLLITQRLILQPQTELNFYTKDGAGAAGRRRPFGARCRTASQVRDHPQVRAVYRHHVLRSVRRHGQVRECGRRLNSTNSLHGGPSLLVLAQ